MQMTLAYDGGLTCSLSVTDMDRSIAWYEKILGFKLMYRADDIGWCEMSTGVERVSVGLSQVEEAGGKGGATLTFGVKDIVAAKKSLDSHAVRQDGDIQDIPGMVRLISFYDPDNNALMLYQDMQGQE
jgi:predicted enzyme related to lactoylglutathione lyase